MNKPPELFQPPGRISPQDRAQDRGPDRMAPPAGPHPGAAAADPHQLAAGRRGAGQEAEHRGFYADFFGFAERPFTLLPDPEMLHWSPQYRGAFSVLEFGVTSRSPITLLTGAIGCGKTTLLRELLRQLDDGLTVGLISNAQGGRGELIQWVLNALGVGFDHAASYVTLFQQMQDFMVAEYAAGRRVLLIFDEAQNLSLESLEELRMLTNINSGKDEVVQLVLVGQPELREMIRRPSLVQLAQRIAVSYHLRPLDEAQTQAFVSHRLRVAGGTGEEFTPEARARVFRVTGGVPRLINQLCDMALLYAWSVESRQVSEEILAQVLRDNIFFAVQDGAEAGAAAAAAADRSAPPGAGRAAGSGAAAPAAVPADEELLDNIFLAIHEPPPAAAEDEPQTVAERLETRR